MPSICPKCKAHLLESESCQDLFDRLLKKELEHPGYYSAHYLSVPCYMLQHNQYSREGWLEVRKLLAKYIYENWTQETARLHAHRKSESVRSTTSFTRSLQLIEVENIAWSYAITNLRYQSAEVYCLDVRHWARSILEDTEPLIRKLNIAD